MIDHLFNFESPVITVVARDAECSRREVFCATARVCVCARARAFICGYVSMSCTACVRICMTCITHADLKVEAWFKLNIRMKHTRLPRVPRMHASYSRMSRTPCTHVTYATLCTPIVACVRGVHGIRACVACVRGMCA